MLGVFYEVQCPNCCNLASDHKLLHKSVCPVCLGLLKDITDIKTAANQKAAADQNQAPPDSQPNGTAQPLYLTPAQLSAFVAAHLDPNTPNIPELCAAPPPEFKPQTIDQLCHLNTLTQEFSTFFTKAIGSPPWKIQQTWAKRFLLKQSSALLAPTGIGKTTFGLVLSLFIHFLKKNPQKAAKLLPTTLPAAARSTLTLEQDLTQPNCPHFLGISQQSLKKAPKIYLIFATKALVLQAYERLNTLAQKLNLNPKIVAYTGKKAQKDLITAGKFDILITTSMFLYKNVEQLQRHKYSFIFVDDVDSILKSSKRVDSLLLLMGISPDQIQTAWQLIQVRRVLSKTQATALQNSKQTKLPQELQELQQRLNGLQSQINKAKQNISGVLFVSTATAKPKNKRLKLFREFLDFEVGQNQVNLRNIVQVYEDVTKIVGKNEYVPTENLTNPVSTQNSQAADTLQNTQATKPEDTPQQTTTNPPRAADPLNIPTQLFELTAKRTKTLGGGGLIFLSSKYSQLVEPLTEFLNNHGVTAASYKDIKTAIEGLKNGKYQALVGIASYKNPLARGIDLPDVIRYALFVGVPVLELNLDLAQNHRHLFTFFINTLFFLDKFVSSQELEFINQNLRRLRNFTPPPQQILNKFSQIAQNLVNNPKFVEFINKESDVQLIIRPDAVTLIVADVVGYIQASGRTSRLYAGGLTKGLSYLLMDNPKAFASLKRKLKYFNIDADFKPAHAVDLAQILKEIDQDRQKVKLFLSGKLKATSASSLPAKLNTTLIIVESPNKARTIANFFGKPSRRIVNQALSVYEVNTPNGPLLISASKGHIYDLATDPTVKPHIFGVLRATPPGQKQPNFYPIFEPIEPSRQQIINGLKRLSIEVDRILVATDPDTEGEKIAYDLKATLYPYAKDIKRIEFHEITPYAFKKALQNPQDVNLNLVKAQLMRRIADRWIGFGLSLELQKLFKRTNLSAGRVQTPVLGWIIQRYTASKQKIAVLEVGIRPQTNQQNSKADAAQNAPSPSPPDDLPENPTKSKNAQNSDTTAQAPTPASLKLEFKLTTQQYEVLRQVLKAATKASNANNIANSATHASTTAKTTAQAPQLTNLLAPISIEKTSTETKHRVVTPYVTHTMLQDATQILKFSPQQTMQYAQTLFEHGLITYHRTDSMRVSKTGQEIAKEYITQHFGADYYKPRSFASSHGAHECIRPTQPLNSLQLREKLALTNLKLPYSALRFYDLIFRRFIASQMKEDVFEETRFKASTQVLLNTAPQDQALASATNPAPHANTAHKAKPTPNSLTLTTEFKTITKVLEPGAHFILPLTIMPITPGTHAPHTAYLTLKPAEYPYTYAQIIAKMQQEEIGRPSTYAITIEKLLQRRYIIEAGSYLIPTKLGIKIYNLLINSPKSRKFIVPEYTRHLEKVMDQIANNQQNLQENLRKLYRELREKELVKELNNT